MTLCKRLTQLMALMLLTFQAQGGIIYESLPAPAVEPNHGALAIDNEFWVYQNFEITEEVNVGTVGGYFENYDASINVFAALIALDSLFDRPDSFDLSTPDVIATTVFNVGVGYGDYSGALSTTLGAGYYALAFGTGAFGADVATDTTSLSLPSLLADVSGVSILPYTGIQDGNAFGTPQQFVLQASAPRVFLTSATAVPAPATLFLILIGCVRFIRRRN